MIALPDLLHLEPRIAVDNEVLHELLDLGFLGKETGSSFDQALSEAMMDVEGWDRGFFADDLFIRDVVNRCFDLNIDGKTYTVNERFLFRILSDPPTDSATVAFRQGILRELDEDADLRARFTRLYTDLYQLLGMFKVPGHGARLDINAFRLDLLRHAKQIIDNMVTDFPDARSGIRRLHEAGREIQASEDYKVMAALLDYDEHLGQLNLDIRVGATGRITHLAVREITENHTNRFYKAAWKRGWDRLRFVFNGYRFRHNDVVSRLVHEVFLRISPSFTPLIQILGHLELYLTARSFRARAEARGLAMSLATFDNNAPLEMSQLFNPLLLNQPRAVVPNSICSTASRPTVIVTGPNSGGKTRLLQAIGLAQVLGQCGVYAPAGSLRLPLVQGMYVSLVETEAAGHAEGRLGRELMRIRAMFEAMRAPAMVIIDELCSGTNPSEGIEVFSLVLRLLEQQAPVALVSTHFLDYARDLAADPPVDRLEFLQVEVDEDQHSTYQFVPGVAQTSLAAVMAERLGVTFDALSRLIEERRRAEEVPTAPSLVGV